MMLRHFALTPVLLIMNLIVHNCIAQQNINAGGNSVVQNGIHFDYSIGEMAIISTERNSNLILTQGLLQPHSNSNPVEVSGIKPHPNTIKIYPNPALDILFINYTTVEDADITYRLYNISGQLLQQAGIRINKGGNQFFIDLKPFAAGTYQLTLSKLNVNRVAEIKSFQFQKLY